MSVVIGTVVWTAYFFLQEITIQCIVIISHKLV